MNRAFLCGLRLVLATMISLIFLAGCSSEQSRARDQADLVAYAKKLGMGPEGLKADELKKLKDKADSMYTWNDKGKFPQNPEMDLVEKVLQKYFEKNHIPPFIPDRYKLFFSQKRLSEVRALFRELTGRTVEVEGWGKLLSLFYCLIALVFFIVVAVIICGYVAGTGAGPGAGIMLTFYVVLVVIYIWTLVVALLR